MFNPTWEMNLYMSQCPIKDKPWLSYNYQDFFYFNGIDYMPEIQKLDINILSWDLSDNELVKLDNNPPLSASHKSNYFKWYKLATDGGIYSDLDILYFKPIDKFYDTINNDGYDTAIGQLNYLSIGFLASAGNNDFYKDIFLNTFNSFNQGDYQSAGVMNIYNLYVDCPYDNVFNVAQAKYPHLKFYNIPMDLVYPFDSTRIDEAFNSDMKITDLPDISIGYHWYAGSLTAQDFNNLINEQNYKSINSLFTNIVKEIL